MQVRYQCDFDDYCEANGLPLSLARRGMPDSQSMTRPQIGLILFFITLVGVGLLYSLATGAPQSNMRTRGYREPVRLHLAVNLQGSFVIERFAKAVLPALAVVAWIVIAWMRQQRRNPGTPWKPQRARFSWTGAALLVCLFVASFFYLLWVLPSGPASYSNPRTAPTAYEITLASAPIGLLIFLSRVALSGMRRGNVRRLWNAQPYIGLPHMLDVSDSKLRIASDQVAEEFVWGHLRGYRETRNLLLLYPSPVAFWIIPKRAFTDPEQLDVFKSVLQRHVKTGLLQTIDQAVASIPLARAGPPAASRTE